VNPVDLILAAEAASSGRARRRRLYRHVHLEPDPLAIAAMQMAGEPHALWGMLIGRDPERPRLIVAPEPRNRDIVYAALAELAVELCAAVDAAAAVREDVTPNKGETWQRCTTAPQLLVANGAVVSLLDRLGRRMRPAGFGGRVVVPAEVNLAGGHLGFYAEAASHPGSALVLIASKELARHAVSGQSNLEDAHLGAQLAWWDPAFAERIVPGCLGGADPATVHGATAAALLERVPMSVLNDPRKDNGPLQDALTRFNESRAGATDRETVTRLDDEIREQLRDALLPTWRALWVARDALAALAPAPGAENRWLADLGMFTRHADFLASGGRRASVDSARRAALLLATWERAEASVERDEVLEDPLAMAGTLASGRAIEGAVLYVDTNNKELSPAGKTYVKRPLVTLACPDDCPFPVGTELWWTQRPGQLRAEVYSTTAVRGGGSTVVLKVVGGMQGALPEPGEQAIFSVYTTSWVPPAALPETTPWTHVPDAGSERDDGAELDDGPPLDTALGLGVAG
jgi:hypothetical protein